MSELFMMAAMVVGQGGGVSPSVAVSRAWEHRLTGAEAEIAKLKAEVAELKGKAESVPVAPIAPTTAAPITSTPPASQSLTIDGRLYARGPDGIYRQSGGSACSGGQCETRGAGYRPVGNGWRVFR